MEKGYEKKYHDVESENWWFKSRRQYIIDLVKDAPKDSKILDIGCSSGMLILDLQEVGFNPSNLFGIDISETAIENARHNGLQNVFVMDAQNITLAEKFDIIISSDCLEHLQDDKKALKNWNQLLNPNGKLYVFVPAFQSLWSNHDVVNMHYRRYTRTGLKTKIEDEQLQIINSGYWNFSLFLPVFIFRKIKNILGGKEDDKGDIVGSPVANSVLLQLINIENKLLKFINFPFGVSTFCIAVKK